MLVSMTDRKYVGWKYSSVGEYLPSMCRALGLISSTTKKKKERK
jgi:hypothetical protein